MQTKLSALSTITNELVAIIRVDDSDRAAWKADSEPTAELALAEMKESADLANSVGNPKVAMFLASAVALVELAGGFPPGLWADRLGELALAYRRGVYA